MSKTNAVKLLRVIRTGPEKLHRAFLEADALAKVEPEIPGGAQP